MFNKIKNEIKTEVEAMNIGNNISALRKKKGITQEELANELGVSAQAVSKWENNSSCPDVSFSAFHKSKIRCGNSRFFRKFSKCHISIFHADF